jgi:hypothetical protein
MAQTGYTPILIYSSSTTTNVPAAGNLTNSTLGSELAINITDGKLFYKDNANNVQVIAWKTTPTTAGGTGLTTYTAGDTLYYASGTTLSKLAIGASKTIMTSSGTAPQWSASLDTTQGGTGLTTFTAGDLPYYAAGTALSKLGIGAANTVLTSSGTAPQWTAQSSLSVGTASNLLSNATTGVMQIVGPGAATTRVMTIPNANFTVARTDTGQTFTGLQTFSSDQDAILTTIYNTKSTGFNNLLVFLRSDQNTTNDSFRPLAYYNGGAAEYRFYVDDAGKVWTKDNIIIGTSGKGIDFSATGGTGTSELLDDYEEGTFTPTITGLTTAGTGTYTSGQRVGRYTKIGNRVYFSLWVRWTAHTGTGDFSVTGLPFTSSNTSSGGNYHSVTVGYAESITLTASRYLAALISPNVTEILPRQLVVGGGSPSLVPIPSSAVIGLSGCYEV